MLPNLSTRTSPAGPAHRARWAAFGAAVAVTLGAGSIGLVSATAPDGASAYVPIDPCRLADTRPSSNVGPVGAPLGPDGVVTFDGRGDVAGDCNLPTTATALQLNVTAVDASQLTNLRFYPAGGSTPTVSNLNPSPGAPPTPNAVTVSLNAEGRFDVFNRFGEVDIVIDVAGYYTDHQHDDRYYTKAEIDAMPSAAKSFSLPITSAIIKNATYDAVNQGGIVLPDTGFPYPTVEHSFVLPGDYTSGTPISVDLIWRTSGNCAMYLSQNFLRVSQPGDLQVGGGSIGITIDGVTPAAAEVATTTVATIVAPDPDVPLEAGDAIVFGIYRRGDATIDTCAGMPLVLTGMQVRYQ